MSECNILNEGYHFVKDYGYCEVIWGDLKSKNFHVLPQDFLENLLMKIQLKMNKIYPLTFLILTVHKYK